MSAEELAVCPFCGYGAIEQGPLKVRHQSGPCFLSEKVIFRNTWNRRIAPTREIEMLRECNAQLVVSEQSIRNECNNLRRQLLQHRVVINEILAEHSATSREASEIGHSDGLWLKPSLFQAASKLVT